MADQGGGGGGGGVKAKAVMLVVMLVTKQAAGMTTPMEAMEMEKTPLHTDEGDCRVGPSLRVEEQPLKVSLLAYVTCSDNVKMGFFLPGQDPYKDRDAVSFNSTGGTHSEVRGGKWTKTPLAFPRLIPEGWNTFRVTADKRGVEVALVEGRDTTTLFTLPHAPDTLHAEGRVARCSRVTPAWEVSAGEKALVPLQPPWGNGHHQWVEVSGEGWEGASPYVTFLCSANSKEIRVATNTTFMITMSSEGANIHYNVSKVAKNGGGDGDGDEVVMNCSVPINDSLELEVVGGRGGNDSTTITTTLVRLWLSSPHTVSQCGSSSTGYGIGFYVALGLLVIALLLIRDVKRWYVVLATALPRWAKKNVPRQSNENNAPVKGDGEGIQMDSADSLLTSVHHRQEDASADQ
ncbi:uncharacterized protein LOC126995414 [Eriocheir sinensis]|uniref:uncharacterized protein LOC126995414 n=1 Tax=Eriocheir sinensis TaxID=95602 RepID=UPI0021C7F38D|nr:uncharacterized protein LOC126995414 [Eriocheir sinensis]